MEFSPLDFNAHNMENFDFANMTGLVFNFSMEEAIDIFNKENNRLLDAYFLNALIVIYIFLIVTGLFSNTMVWLVVVLRAQMRTPRNFYVVNLTVSDITLCIISMPFTLLHFIEMQWNFGIVLCKLVPVVQGTNIFVSTGTVMAIALDRYFTIVRSVGAVQDKYRVLLSIALIWIVSCLFTLPIMFYQVVEEESIGTSVVFRHCIEKWPSPSRRVAYTFGLLVFQLVIPILVLAGVHVAIANHLNAHTFVPSDPSNCGGEGKKFLGKKSFFRSRRKNPHIILSEPSVTLDAPTKCSGGIRNGSDNSVYKIDKDKAEYKCLTEGLTLRSPNNFPRTHETQPIAERNNKFCGSGGPGAGTGTANSSLSPSLTALKRNGTETEKDVGTASLSLGQLPYQNDTHETHVVDRASNLSKTPLNVKFKSNIGVCITFREFCQLSTGKGGGGIGFGSKKTEQPLQLEQLELEHNNKLHFRHESEDRSLTDTSFVGSEHKEESFLCNEMKERTRQERASVLYGLNDGAGAGQGQSGNKTTNFPASVNTVCPTQLAPPPSVQSSPRIPTTVAVTKRTKKELARNRRTTIILLMVAVIFTISWMPWHLLTLWADLHPNFTTPSNLYMLFAICHIIAMTSAVTNAVLYGWLNTNLRRELVKMLSVWMKR